MPICEMCGADASLTEADVDGAELKLCPKCLKFGVIRRKGMNLPNRFRSNNNYKKKDDTEFKIIEDFADKLRSIREKKNLTQEDFAKFINEKESSLHKWENAQFKPSIETARRLEKIFDTKFVEKDYEEEYDFGKKKEPEEMTLGDFIKIKKRN